LLCCVPALFREIVATELQKRDEDATLFPQMFIEGETAYVMRHRTTGFVFILRSRGIEAAECLYILLQGGPEFFHERQQKAEPDAAFRPLGGNMRIEESIHCGSRLGAALSVISFSPPPAEYHDRQAEQDGNTDQAPDDISGHACILHGVYMRKDLLAGGVYDSFGDMLGLWAGRV